MLLTRYCHAVAMVCHAVAMLFLAMPLPRYCHAVATPRRHVLANMAVAWPSDMAMAWQWHGNNMAGAWQWHGTAAAGRH